jgi:hypothetical protein
LEVLPGVGGIGDGVALGLSDILLLLNEEINLEIEWSLNLQEVVVVDLFESVSSKVKNALDVVSSFGINCGNGSLN